MADWGKLVAGLVMALQLCVAPACARSAEGRDWAPDAQDARRALPNVSAPPDRREPSVMLPPLPESEAGIIRRVSVPGGRKVAALTFDLCELDTVTTGCDMAVLAYLRREGVPATLFMGGKWMRTHARRVRQLMAEPLFEIGNHNWTHGNCALLSAGGLRAQVLWTQAQYELLREDVLRAAEAAGRPAPPVAAVPGLFRLPYGRSSAAALSALAGMGLRVVQWDVVAEDGDNSDPARARRAGRRVADGVRSGSIVLFHANGVPRGTANLVPAVVARLRERGFQLVTVGQLLTMGQPERVRDGYFSRPGDNRFLDGRFGVDGTGRRRPFTGDRVRQE